MFYIMSNLQIHYEFTLDFQKKGTNKHECFNLKKKKRELIQWWQISSKTLVFLERG